MTANTGTTAARSPGPSRRSGVSGMLAVHRHRTCGAVAGGAAGSCHAGGSGSFPRRVPVGSQSGAPRRARGVGRRRDPSPGDVGDVPVRPPLAVLLYLAGQDGLLVWRDADAFAVLKPPAVSGYAASGGSRRIRWLRLLDRWWDLLVFAVPPASLLVVAAALLPFPTAWLVAGISGGGGRRVRRRVDGCRCGHRTLARVPADRGACVTARRSWPARS